MAELQTRIICPVCGMNKLSSSFERNDEHAFGTWDETRDIIQIRAQEGGKASDMWVGTGRYRKTAGRGFPITDRFVLGEAKNMDEYRNYINQIADQLLKVLKIFHGAGLITNEDLDSIKV